MPYRVEIKLPVGDKFKAKVVNKSFACTPYEFLQELATHLKVPKIAISRCSYFNSLEAAEILAEAFNNDQRNLYEQKISKNKY